MGLQAKLPWLLLSYLFSLIVVPTVNGQPNRPPTNPQGRPTPNQGKQNSPEFKDLAFERLSLKPLDDGKVSAHFEFDFVHKDGVPRDPRTLGMKEADQHYEFLPLSLGQILREYAVAEVHLTMNNGRWNYPLWGYPENAAVASGVELWAWMADGGVRSIDERWSGLSNALAGLFCASLSALPDSRTTIPIHSFRPDGKLPAYVGKSSNAPSNDTVDQNYVLRHAVLPSESICTENLTPFIKLLPCKTHAGLAELLNPHKIFSGWWYGVGIHATWHDGIAADANSGVEQPVFAGKTIEEMDSKARAGKYEETGGMKKVSDEEINKKGKSERRTPPSEIKNAGVKLKLTVGTVLNPPHPSTGSHSLTLESLFGKNVTKSCPIVSTPDVRIHRPNPVAEGRKDAGNTAPRLVPDPIARYYAPSAWIATESESGLILGEATWDVLRVSETGLNLTVNQEYSPYQGKTSYLVPTSSCISAC
ncbi:Subunit of the glycosylphosphatidylinositol transamidase complex-like protein [Serendipita sp. 405]|nr:Subunit of the glycosylphosphatidylinositol transamidase complex-like protein [Serendipita sp. 405]